MPIPHFTTDIQELHDASLRRITRVLNPQQGFVSVVIPVARQNDVQNPSFETNTTNWSAAGGASLARSAAQQYHGAYSLQVTPAAGTNSDGAIYGATTPLALTAGTAYAVSCKILGQSGATYRIAVTDTSNVVLSSSVFVATGRWQWAWVFHFETSSTNRRIQIGKSSNSAAQAFYIDGVQSEACAAGAVYPTTYIDGDQVGLIANQSPSPYLWLGTPHASASTRSGQTRAGGRVVNLDTLGFQLINYVGLGLMPLNAISLPFSQADGAQYLTTIAPPRGFQLAGLLSEAGLAQLQRVKSNLADALGRDLIAQRQPLVLLYQAFDCLTPIGDVGRIVCAYDDGLRGDTASTVRENVTLGFTQFLPVITGGDAGAALTASTTVANANGVLFRTAAGAWQALGTGLTGADPSAVALTWAADNVTLYVGGPFTGAGGVANTAGIAAYNTLTGAWSALGTGGAASAGVNVILRLPNGSIYALGGFTAMGGAATSKNAALWNGSAWTGLNYPGVDTINGACLDKSGVLYTVDNGGKIYSYNGAWTLLGTSTGGPYGGLLRAAVIAPNGDLIIGGGFTSVSGVTTTDVARYTLSAASPAWTALGGPSSGTQTRSLAYDDAGVLFACDISGGSPSFAYYTGASWVSMGLGSSAFVAPGAAGSNTVLAGGIFTSANGVTLPSSVLIVTGVGGLTYLPIILPGVFGTMQVRGFGVRADGALAVGFNTTGSATVGASTTVTNPGTAAASPRITFTGPSSGSSRLFSIQNLTTGKSIYLNTTINAGETITLDLNPNNITFTSTYQGNVYRTVLPGSDVATFTLQPGANTIVWLADNSTVSATIQFPIGYQSVEDLTP